MCIFTTVQEKFDYTIIGAGAAGTLLAYEMTKNPFFSQKRILILDRGDDQRLDRTWSYWERGEGELDHLLLQQWSQFEVAFKQKRYLHRMHPYRYKTIEGTTFHQYFDAEFLKHKNILIRHEEVQDCVENELGVTIHCQSKNVYQSDFVFDSRFNYPELKSQTKYPVLQQHFIGWFVETEEDVFDELTPKFMDFTVEQKGNTRFMYVLPFSKNKALVEYTLFSAEPLAKKEYEDEIVGYLKEMTSAPYKVIQMESGNIPMCCYPLWKKTTSKIMPIGMAGGWTKASTGYTFKSSQEKAKALALFLTQEKDFKDFYSAGKFWIYDMLLLDILYKSNEKGAAIFTSLFKRRKAPLILKFLEEKTSFAEDVMVMAAPRPWPFIKALLGRVFSGF